MVVFPVPTSPVSRTKPWRSITPYFRMASASLCFSPRYKNLGDVLRLKGFSISSKNSVYIETNLWVRQDLQNYQDYCILRKKEYTLEIPSILSDNVFSFYT